MMLLSWTSATNCACIYNTNSAESKWKPMDWKFSLEVITDKVYDAFTVLSLHEECQLQNLTLIVPHGGLARDCFTEAINTHKINITCLASLSYSIIARNV